MAETGIEMGGEFGLQGVQSMHGGLKTFGPGGLRRGRPTVADSSQVVAQGGVEAGFSRGKGHE